MTPTEHKAYCMSELGGSCNCGANAGLPHKGYYRAHLEGGPLDCCSLPVPYVGKSLHWNGSEDLDGEYRYARSDEGNIHFRWQPNEGEGVGEGQP